MDDRGNRVVGGLPELSRVNSNGHASAIADKLSGGFN